MPDEYGGILDLAGTLDAKVLANLVTGATIGATGALVAAVILGSLEWWRRWRRRREQIAFIRKFFVKRFTAIRDEKQIPPLPNGNPAPTIHKVRWIIYKNILRDLEVILSYRMTTFSYDKIHDVWSVLTSQRGTNEALFNERTRVLPPPSFYPKFYGDFKNIDWLGLPSDLFPSLEETPQESS